MSQRLLTKSRCARFLLAVTFLFCAIPLTWADSVSTSYLEGQVPVAPDALTTYGPDLFGDKVNLYNGALEFEQTDLSLPGNNALAVALVRRFTPGRMPFVRGQFGDWDIVAPRISGNFGALGWLTYAQGSNRCSGFSAPPSYSEGGTSGSAGFTAVDYWQGTMLDVPGHGVQEVLSRSVANTAQPTDGSSYPLVTRNQWQISCLPTVQNHAGEGFVATSPDGTRYRFDWMARRQLASVRKANTTTQRFEYFLFATEVIDRFGNWVRYAYNASSPMELQGIESSDGRLITLTYAGGRVVAASDGTRTFNYTYSPQNDLVAVLQPDGSQWTFNLAGMLHPLYESFGEGAKCDSPGIYSQELIVGTMSHPSGAVGTFSTKFVAHGKTFVQQACKYLSGTSGQTTGAVWPRLTRSQTLVSKTISGPGLEPLTWSYAYLGGSGWMSCTTCWDRKIVTVTTPNGVANRHIFGNRWRVNEGQLLQLEEGWNGVTALRTTTYRYRQPDGQRFPDVLGLSHLVTSDLLAASNRPLDQKVALQQGGAFTWQVRADPLGFDELARPLIVLKSSSLGSSRTETTAYRDHPDRWIMGQIERVSEQSTGAAVVAHDYHPVHASRTASFSFGRLVERLEYNPDGTVLRALDPVGRATTYADHKRGIAQAITRRDGTQETAVVNNLGKLDSHTNAVGSTHRYAYDPMGRLARIDYPPEEGFGYLPTVVNQSQREVAEYGLAAGHWRQSVSTGSGYRYRYFDALWRVRLDVSFDANSTADTLSFKEVRYDAGNRKSFEGYPSRSFSEVDQAIAGMSTTYDGLDRVVQQRADSELGPLTTTSEYLTGYQKLVTNPRGQATRFAYQAFDTPGEDHIAEVWSPESVSLSIARDVFGKPLSITRGGTWSGGTQSLTRSYVYTADQRLCKTIEPETGATVQAYDLAGNVSWRASGLALPSTGNCDLASVPENARTNFSYDARDRLTWTIFGDGSRSVERRYWPDGLLKHVFSGDVWWTYHYNNRRLPTHEEYTWWAGARSGEGWNLVWDYDRLGNVASLRDPWGTLQYAPNALGQPTAISGYATSISYHPNGAVAGYILDNGVTHTLTQNVRGLPEESRDIGVTSDRYTYDVNGNVAGIVDQQEGVASRSMGYDGLDRLKVANGTWGAGAFAYDALDNLRSSTLGGRSLSHNVDSNNRLISLTGSQNIGIGYDANGNVTQRGSQAFVFDIGNRMLSAPGKVNSYIYDGHGRRSQAFMADGTWRLYAYGRDGKLRVSHRSDQAWTRHIYLGDKLIAETMSAATTFVHTDALGSPVARTNSIGTLLSRTRYEPYGATAGGANPIGIGFTGHVNDVDTGLVYMQQRYYDPIAGRFLSVDPVVTDTGNGSSFNRYVFAKNNPYKFKDPDGRFANFVWGALIGGGIELGFQLADGKGVNWTSVGVAAGVGSVTGGVGGINARLATTGAITAREAVMATAAAGGLASATGKNVEAGLTGESTSPKDVALSGALGAAGSAIGAKLSTKLIGNAEKAAASKDNVVSGMGRNALGAVREGGATSSVTTGSSAVTQKGADLATGAASKEIENRTK